MPGDPQSVTALIVSGQHHVVNGRPIEMTDHFPESRQGLLLVTAVATYRQSYAHTEHSLCNDVGRTFSCKILLVHVYVDEAGGDHAVLNIDHLPCAMEACVSVFCA